MASFLLGALLLLLLLAGRGAWAGPEGELCPTWVPELGSPGGAFRCPQLRDDADAKFCCGTCQSPYCCAAGEAKLEGERCRRSPLLEAPSTQPPSPKTYPDWLPVLVFFILLIGGMLLWIAVCYCKERYWRRRTYYLYPNASEDESRDSIPLASLPPPPPYLLEPPPPYSVQDPHGTWNQTPSTPPLSQNSESSESLSEASAGSLVHRHVSGHSSASTLEADALADE